jgi:hypothetical protein
MAITMEDEKLPKILLQTPTKTTFDSRRWHVIRMYSPLNHWGVKEEIILQNKDIITSKFKEKMWCHTKL